MKKYQIILISFAALLLIMGVVGAAEVDDITNDTIVSDNIIYSDDILYSNNYSDVVSSNKEVNGNTFSDLQDVIYYSSAGDTIFLNNDIYQDSSNYIYVNKTVTIDGKGHTLDAQQKSSIFYIEHASNVVLKNMIFKNAKSVNGGAIYAGSGLLNVSNCTFINNSAKLGGAVYCEVESSLVYCTFENNSAEQNGGAVFSKKDIDLSFSTFTANHAQKGGAVYCTNNQGTIIGSDFIGNTAVDGGAIYWDGRKLEMEFDKFMNNTASKNGGAVFLNSCNQIDISYASFFNSNANEGGALYFLNSAANLVSSFFINNSASKGGSISFVNSTNMVEYCGFERNSADEGGAILLNNSQSNIEGSNFEFNTAFEKGSAIYWAPLTYNLNCTISSSEFYNNKVKSYSLTGNFTNGNLILELKGWNNYVNAIYADTRIELKDVRYYNGNITNSDKEADNNGASGQNITLEIYDSSKNLLINTTFMTNTFGQQYYNLFLLKDGQYTYKAYHSDNDYYTSVQCNGKFTLNRPASSISLNITDKEEFIYGQCVIPFNIMYRTDVVAVITNEDGSAVYYNSTVNEYSRRVYVDLPAQEEYYKITVYNVPNSKYLGSQDSKLFKILKTGSSISINPVNDFNYGRNPVISFNVENMTYILVTVYNEDGRGVYSTTSDDDYIVFPVLNIGKYYMYAENMASENITSSTSSATTFNILKATNTINVSASNVGYGNPVVITVHAWVDGDYNIDVNGTLVNVRVAGGQGETELSLPVGQYYANAIFNNPNYDTDITNAKFSVLPVCDIKVNYNEDVVSGENIIFNVAVDNDATGNITLYFANDEYTTAINNGKAIIEVSNVGSGDHNVSIVYDGDENYAGNKVDLNVHVKTFSIMLNPLQSNVLSATLYDEDGNGVSNREVLFSIDGQSFISVTDSKGIASVNSDLAVGAHHIRIIYLYQNITDNITVSRFSGNKNINMYYFDGSKYTFKVYGDDGNAVGANQNVVIKLNKKSYTVKTDKNGVVSFKIPSTVKTGTYAITASYKGDSIKNTVKVKQILTSKKTVKVKKTAKKLVLTVKLNKKLKNKPIIFKFKGKKYAAKTDKYGIAKVTIKKNVISKLSKGKSYTVSINYYKISLKTKVKVM
ncbi:Ig-like domain repeat protein [Methanobrevibacter sp.]|uniref:Ig-like domain repeat protein n=1 Tax=Methanobrevibacter sp. TaxID=66852 RepID=UPI0038904813